MRSLEQATPAFPESPCCRKAEVAGWLRASPILSYNVVDISWFPAFQAGTCPGHPRVRKEVQCCCGFDACLLEYPDKLTGLRSVKVWGTCLSFIFVLNSVLHCMGLFTGGNVYTLQGDCTAASAKWHTA